MSVPCQDCGQDGLEFDLSPVFDDNVRLCSDCFSEVMAKVINIFGMEAAARVCFTVLDRRVRATVKDDS